MTSETEYGGEPPSETSFAGHLCIHCGMLTTQCVCTPESLAKKQYQSTIAFQQKIVEKLERVIELLEPIAAFVEEERVSTGSIYEKVP
jgi:hypothetical protein